MKKVMLMFAVMFTLFSCNQPGTKPGEEKAEAPLVNALTEAEIADGWMLLFDGQTPGKWRGYGKDYFPQGWGSEDSTLRCICS